MVSIARKNLFFDKIKLIITLIGVAFSVFLILSLSGIYLGLMANTSTIIDNTDADIWITSKNCRNFDFALPVSSKKMYLTKSIEGVDKVEKLVLEFTITKAPNGATESIELVGFNPDTGIGGPWGLKEGSFRDVKYGRTAIVDLSSRKKLGPMKIGDKREIFGKSVKIVGFTNGIKAFTTAPYFFVSIRTAQELSLFGRGDNATFILVKIKPGYEAEEIAERIKKRLKGVDVYTRKQFSWKTKMYWTWETGMGMNFLIVLTIGIVVGMVIVGQTIYNSTIEHLREFGTLKAIGATNWDIYKIIFEQAIINAVCGYFLGLFISSLAVKGYEAVDLSMYIPSWAKIVVFFLSLGMCLGSSFISIRKATTVDPVVVFRA